MKSPVRTGQKKKNKNRPQNPSGRSAEKKSNVPTLKRERRHRFWGGSGRGKRERGRNWKSNGKIITGYPKSTRRGQIQGEKRLRTVVVSKKVG